MSRGNAVHAVVLSAALLILPPPPVSGADPTREAATGALRKAVNFFRANCSPGGGYVYRVSSDLTQWEGEKKVTRTQAWIQPPGTPAVGSAYLEAWQLTGDPLLKEAALATADALIRGQMTSGGWDEWIEFDPAQRGRYAYRVEGPPSKQRKANETTFDDNKSQSCARFLMRLDQALQFEDANIHEATRYALDSFVKAQYPNGAWPQQYQKFPRAEEFPVLKASFPATWPRTFPAIKYSSYYTLNDGTQRDLIVLMLDAADIYNEPRYREAAKRGGEFLILAQLPEPQPGWAQQYDREMHPAWARKFEPPAISGLESQGAIEVLMTLYRRTGEKRFLEPIPTALAYYAKLSLPDGRYARFYEIGTNKPLYFTEDYKLTYSDADVPTHYGFKVDSKFDRLSHEFGEVRALPGDKLWSPPKPTQPRKTNSLTRAAGAAIEALDERGAWVEEGWITSKMFQKNLLTLAEFVATEK